jgi:pimeloyl-ACP methyl ester carboxylesterase
MRVFALFLAACAAATLNWTEAAQSKPLPGGAAEQRLPHISVTSMGKGAPVMLVPGLSTPRAMWDGVTPELARDHRVLLVQVNGFAGDDPKANLNGGILDGIVEDLHGYIAAHRLKHVRLVGHSMGGLAALMFARAHPDEVERVVVVDALPFFAVLMDPAATVESVKPTAAMMRSKIAASYGKPADPATIEANVKSLALKPESISRMKQWAGAADSRVTAQALYEDLTTDIRPQLASIRTPVTLIVPWSAQGFGEERTLAFYKRQFATLANVKFVGVADAGHFVMLDQPHAFADALRDFVK